MAAYFRRSASKMRRRPASNRDGSAPDLIALVSEDKLSPVNERASFLVISIRSNCIGTSFQMSEKGLARVR
jgi:hypothetical protein